MITLAEYVGPHAASPDWTDERKTNAGVLLGRVNPLIEVMRKDGIRFHGNPKTQSLISGETYGGFRPKDCPIGAAGSPHKEARGIDLFDPHANIGHWCVTHLDDLAFFGLYLEHPSATPTWCHLQDRAPRSGRRVFYP